MNGKSYLVDTNMVIDIFKGSAKSTSLITDISQIYLSSTIIDELYFGAYNSNNSEKHLKQVKDFIAVTKVVNISSQTSETYGQIKSTLRKKGTPIPENDIWIAAVAKENQMTILTSDAHFKMIGNLNVEFL